MRRRVAWMWMRTLKVLLALQMLSLPFVLPSLHEASNVEIAKLTFQVFIAVFVLAALVLSFFPCPKCGKSFIGFRSPGVKQCWSCGTKFGS